MKPATRPPATTPLRAPRHAFAAMLLACVVAAPGPAIAANINAPPVPELASLAGGTIHVSEAPSPGLPGKAFTAWTLSPTPVAQLCATVQDYASYASFMPNTKSALPVGEGDGYVLVDMTLDLPLGQQKKYRLRLEQQQQPDSSQCKLAWRLIPSGIAPADTIADTTGYWLFTPIAGESGRTLIEYHVYADPGPVPYGFGWIVEMMSKRSLPRTLEALRAQAAK
ncbi:Polyketide cyclase / dehydrase and lipid transport [Duganella sp. CF458]|uniref:hypothetical protein n=1 Tax=Duganella sp. CF458 TaxID=1884368 RepID=UPI0008E9ED4E|nr:hypothetical protein [Duganella sp. CF458]SFG75164.1 Polyketide cyclase / dehydrase and lipid transport [Duganella sp. CF458]